MEQKRGQGLAFAVVRNLDTRAKQKVQAILRWCGRDPDTKLTFSLWNSGIEMADWYMKIFRCGLVEDAWDHPEIDIKRFQGLETKLDEIRDYLYRNSKAVVGYARAFRRGERVGTAHVESTVNQLINWRFCKKQQMAWTKAGAQALLHVKTAALNGALHRYTRHTDLGAAAA